MSDNEAILDVVRVTATSSLGGLQSSIEIEGLPESFTGEPVFTMTVMSNGGQIFMTNNIEMSISEIEESLGAFVARLYDKAAKGTWDAPPEDVVDWKDKE